MALKKRSVVSPAAGAVTLPTLMAELPGTRRLEELPLDRLSPAPTEWNFSPRDALGRRGPVEEALVGTPVADAASLVEVGRVVRSFDPCFTCAVHILDAPGAREI